MDKKSVEDQIKGLKNTQAPEVHVRYETIASVLGEKVTDELAVQKVGFSQMKAKSPRLSVSLEELEKVKPNSYGLATFNRQDLLDCLEEAIEEGGGLDAMFPESKDTTSTLQKVRNKVESPQLYSPPGNDEEESEF